MKKKGQSVVEAALVLPMILMVIFGIVEFGQLFNYKLTLNYAVSEAGKAAALRDSPTTLTSIINASVTGFTVAANNITISYKDVNGTAVTYSTSTDGKVYFTNPTQEVFCTIVISYQYEPYLPFPVITTEQFFNLQSSSYVKVQ
ncbi:MAG: TadE/TadG family type IV pilus assembly protein [Candidatus Wallbacteria bacterium]|nr:TadE/TadG family type IV pilus assembly protein [Candidatus Wallbacteria bacterium]